MYRFLFLLLAVLCLAACATPGTVMPQDSTVPLTTSDAPVGNIDFCGITLRGDTTMLHINMTDDVVEVDAEGELENTWHSQELTEELCDQQIHKLSGLTELRSVTLGCQHTACAYGAQENTMLVIFSALPRLEKLSLWGGSWDLQILADYPALEELHILHRDLQDLPAVHARTLYLTSCTGISDDLLSQWPGLFCLYLDQCQLPDSLQAWTDHPTLTVLRIYVPGDYALVDSTYSGELPIVLSASDPEIPQGVNLPYTKEEILAFLRKSPEAKIEFQISMDP